jgi:glucose/arabinose dehydrogenase
MKTPVYVIILLCACMAGPLKAQPDIEIAFPSLNFSRPIDIQNAGDGSNRLFVAEQDGRIWVFPNDSDVKNSTRFLNISSEVSRGGNEEGLLGLAFHPDFASNGYLYVNHSAGSPRRNVIARYEISEGDPNRADEGSRFVILEFNQPFSNHNGGQLAFGPDGYLYIATGDGGSGGDPQGNGQSLTTLLGKILRIDVDKQDPGLNYAIPTDNPFVGSGNARGEIWAYGLRNPWRMSFDPVTGWLWAGDVGQNKYEEIDIIEKGKNYGWKIMEGFHCFSPSSGCDTSGLALPVVEYGREYGVSVTGGHVYRGTQTPELYGAYIYGDFGSGRMWYLRYDGSSDPVNTAFPGSGLSISTFGVDEQGELYFADFGGAIRRFEATNTHADPLKTYPDDISILSVFPNPVTSNRVTNTNISVASASYYHLRLVDGLGRTMQTVHEGNLQPGSHSFQVSLRDQPSGVYYLIMTSSKGMILSESLIIN